MDSSVPTIHDILKMSNEELQKYLNSMSHSERIQVLQKIQQIGQLAALKLSHSVTPNSPPTQRTKAANLVADAAYKNEVLEKRLQEGYSGLHRMGVATRGLPVPTSAGGRRHKQRKQRKQTKHRQTRRRRQTRRKN